MNTNSKRRMLFCSLLFILVAVLFQTKQGHALPLFISAKVKPRININEINSRQNTGVYTIFRQGSGIINYLPICITKTSFKAWCAGGVIADVDNSFLETLVELNPEITTSPLNGRLFPIVFKPASLPDKEELQTYKEQHTWNQKVAGISYLKSTLSLTGKGRTLGVIALDHGITHKCLDGRIKSVMKFADETGDGSCQFIDRSLDDLYIVHPLGLLIGSDSARFEGLAPEISIKLALISSSSNYTSDLLKAIQWIIKSDNSSKPDAILFLTDFKQMPPIAVQNALFACRNVGIVPIAPVGNNPDSVGGIAGLPCTIAVGALDRWKKRALFSGTGPSMFNGLKILKPDVSEPGLAIYGPSDFNKYSFGSGTSQAAVHFVAVYLLIKQLLPNVDSELIINAIKQRADDIGKQGADNETGFGLPVPYLAIDSIQNPPQEDENF